MVDNAMIQARIDAGYSKAATALGQAYQQYRAAGALNPLANPLGSLNIWATTDSALKGTNPPDFGKPQWFSALMRDDLALGDYLVGPLGTFFVSTLQYPAPVGLIFCNQTISIARAQDNLPIGASPQRFGNAMQTTINIITNWPASVLQLGGGEKMTATALNLPTDAKLPGMAILLPASAPSVRFNDLITDATGQRYMVASVETSPLGWRLTAELQPAG